MSDELMELWQEGASSEPDAGTVARLAALATTRRFDRAIFWRNLREYLAGLVLMGVFGTLAVAGESPLRNGVNFVCVSFVMGFLWWRHRDVPRPDPAADARAFQAVMLERVDRQLQLLRTVRYWYLLPLYIPCVLQAVEAGQRGHWGAAVAMMIVVTALYAFLARLNERQAVDVLLEERARIEALYRG
jgi:hypothetical protein